MAGMVARHRRRRGRAAGRVDRRRPASRERVGANLQRRRRRLAPVAGRDDPRPQRAGGDGPERADGLRLPPLLRAADVQQRVVVPVPAARARGDADGDLVAHPLPVGPAAAARADGPRRLPGAAHPHPGLLEPAQAAAGPAQPGLRVHAAVGGDRGPHRQLPPGDRRVPGRRARRALEPREREPARPVWSCRELRRRRRPACASAIATYTQRARRRARPTTSSPPTAQDGELRHRRARHLRRATTSIRAAYAGWAPRRPQRHLVLNTYAHSAWTDDEATASSDVVFLLQGKGGDWAVQVVGQYHRRAAAARPTTSGGSASIAEPSSSR